MTHMVPSWQQSYWKLDFWPTLYSLWRSNIFYLLVFCLSKASETFVIYFNWSRPKLCFGSPAAEQAVPKLLKCKSLWIDLLTSLALFICQKLRGTIPALHKSCPCIHFLSPSKHTAYFPTCSRALKQAQLLFCLKHSQLNWKNELSHKLR